MRWRARSLAPIRKTRRRRRSDLTAPKQIALRGFASSFCPFRGGGCTEVRVFLCVLSVPCVARAVQRCDPIVSFPLAGAPIVRSTSSIV